MSVALLSAACGNEHCSGGVLDRISVRQPSSSRIKRSECLPNLGPNSTGYGRRESIAHLAVGVRLPAREGPAWREAFKDRRHLHRQLGRIAIPSRGRRLISESEPVNAKFAPLLLGLG